MSSVTKEDFAKVLSCKPNFVQTRLIALGHETVCSRCGGGGHYSYCQMYGTRCFQCGGSGKVATKLSASLFATVKKQVANGELQPYLDRIKAASDRKKKVAGFRDKIGNAWKSQPSVASENALHFTKCSNRHHRLNAFCCPLSKEADTLIGLVTNGEWSKEKRGYVQLSEDKQNECVKRLEEILAIVSNAENLVAREADDDVRPFA